MQQDSRMMGLHCPSPGSSLLRILRNMVKLSTRVTLNELRSPPPSGRAKLIISAKTMRMLGSIKVMKGFVYLILSSTWGAHTTQFHSNRYRLVESDDRDLIRLAVFLTTVTQLIRELFLSLMCILVILA